MVKLVKEFLGATMAVSMVVLSAFVVMEPALASAVTDEVVVNQTVTAGITISSPSDVSMSRALTVTDDTATGTTSWTVITNSQSGYTMTIQAAETGSCADRNTDGVKDALCDVSTNEAFADISTTAPATWSVSNEYAFGYSAFGDDNTGFGTGSVCESTSNVPSSSLNYVGFEGTTARQFASSTAETNQAGVETTMCFAVEQDTIFAPSGSYQATTTATAVVQ